MSLLRRIEQGQGGGQQDGASSSSPQQSGGDGKSGGGNDSSRLSSIQARRVSAPITSPQAGSYFDLKPVFKINYLLRSTLPWMSLEQMKFGVPSRVCLSRFCRREYCPVAA